MISTSPRSTSGTLPDTGVSRNPTLACREEGGELVHGRRVDRARLGYDRTRLDPRGDAVGAAVRRDTGRIVGEGDDDDGAPATASAAVAATVAPLAVATASAACRRPVVDDHVGARRAQPTGHRRAHPAGADDGDLHFNSQPPSTGRLTPLIAGLRRRNSTASATSAIVARRPIGVREVT